jgi:hypothetical protein
MRGKIAILKEIRAVAPTGIESDEIHTILTGKPLDLSGAAVV